MRTTEEKVIKTNSQVLIRAIHRNRALAVHGSVWGSLGHGSDAQINYLVGPRSCLVASRFPGENNAGNYGVHIT